MGRQEATEDIASEFESQFTGTQVLVTGGAGFLGSWLCETLSSMSASVDCLDNFSTGRSDNILQLGRKVRVIRADVETARLTRNYDYIFHMSSRASPEEYQKFPIETLRANSVGTLRMLELAKDSDTVLVYASTSEVYGDAEIVPTPESCFGSVNPVGIRSCYDEGKRFGEAMCMAYFRQHEVHVRLPRIFNTYGPRLRSDGIYARVISRFVLQALQGRDLTIHGSGMQTRSFCYVTDTISALLTLASKGKDGGIYNIGNPNEMTIAALANTIIMATGSKSTTRFLKARADDPRRRCPDISKARKLGWKPKMELDEGLIRTIAYFREANHS